MKKRQVYCIIFGSHNYELTVFMETGINTCNFRIFLLSWRRTPYGETTVRASVLRPWPAVSEYTVCQIFMKFDVGVSYKNLRVRLNFLKMRLVTVLLYVTLSVNFYPLFSFLFTALGEIRHRKSLYNAFEHIWVCWKFMQWMKWYCT
jgi:hypothetical protein